MGQTAFAPASLSAYGSFATRLTTLEKSRPPLPSRLFIAQRFPA